jgi:hypothetical protein
MPVRQVSAVELKRLRKKGTVRKKLGAQPVKERSEPVADDDKGMSGSVTPEQPAPILPEPAPVQHAAMGASNVARDAAFEDMLAMNGKVIEEFRREVSEREPRKRVPWDHDLIRDNKTGLLKRIRSTPIES